MSSLLTYCFIKWNHDYSFDGLNKTKHIIFSNSNILILFVMMGWRKVYSFVDCR